MNKYAEYNHVQKCLQLIEQQLGWGSSTSWHNDVFFELSEKIQQQTHVLLSSTTLKRVWGKVNYANAPSISTLNTLAQFAGFENWRDFKTSATEQHQPSWLARQISPNLGVITASAAVMTILFLSLYSMTIKKDTSESDYSNVAFSSKPIAKGLPNSVVFDFNIDGINSDSIYIQQFWDPTKTIKIKKTQKQATGQYYYPGYFRAKLLVDGEIIKEHDLFIKTDNWIGTIDYEPIPKYVPVSSFYGDTLGFDKQAINEIKSLKEPVVSSFHYINEFKKISGDNFVLKASLKNTYTDKWAVCQKATITVVGTKSAYLIPFSISGCVSDIGIMMSEVYLSGKEHDLSSLGTDLSEFKSIKVLTENRTVSVFIEKNQVFTYTYNESIGDVVGLRFRFLGAGEVTDLILKDINNTVVFNNNFKPQLK